MIQEIEKNKITNFKIISKDNQFTKFFAYIIKDNIVGLLEVNHLYEHLDISYIYVIEQERNKDIATKLLKHLIEYGKTNNCENITLEVDEKNIKAYNLYKKLNFKEVAIRKNYYKNSDGILMELIL